MSSNNINIPSHKECISLLKETETPHNIFLHVRKVQGIALFIADAFQKNGYGVNIELIRAAALLHDIKKYHEVIKKCTKHEREGGIFLSEKGYPEVAKIVMAHDTSRIFDGFKSWEEEILYYSDKRVIHDKVVSVVSRMKDGVKRYPHEKENVIKLQEPLIAFEEQIFKKIGLQPQEITEESIAPYLCEDDY